MGSWGEGPFENDTAGDWFDDIQGKLTHQIDKALTRKSDDAFLNESERGFAATGVVLAMAEQYDYGNPAQVEDSIRLIDRMIEVNEPVVLGWVSPRKRMNVLRAHRDRLQRVLNKWNRRMGRVVS